jgi:hypothetical protein
MTPCHCGNSTTWFKGNERVKKNGKKKQMCLLTLSESDDGHDFYNYENNCDF